MSKAHRLSTLLRHRLLRLLPVALLALIPMACNSDFAAAVRRVTYPPDFVYVTEAELRGNMGRLGNQLALLENALVASYDREPVQQEVIDILTRIGQIGSGLQAGEAGANHPFLEDEMPRFVRDVSRARLAAMMDPPQYYLAGRVAGACTNCHRAN